MSGHSKWSTIKRKKGAADAKRGQIFSKFATIIAVAAREGGGDPESNFKLRLAIERARSVNMPKDNIDRAIAKGTGAGGGAALEEVLYEGFAPVSGVAFLVEAVTDNKQRTVAEIKNIIEKNGGTFGSPGSAAHLFEYKGQIVVEKEENQDILSIAVDAGAEDIQEEDKNFVITTAASSLEKVRTACVNSGLKVLDAGLVYIPYLDIDTDNADQKKLEVFLNKLEEHPDVQQVYVNSEIP